MSPKACHFCHLLNQYICNEADHCGACDLGSLEKPSATETHQGLKDTEQ